jgi:hypothetical protein
MSLTKVSYSMINGATVNVFDFLSAAETIQVVTRNQTASAPDVTVALQAAINATPKGGQLRIPNGFYKHTGLTVSKGIEIVGDTPPDFWDNDSTLNLNGGTVLWNSSSSSNNLTVEPPAAADRRLRFHIQDVLLLGALWNGSTFITSGPAYSGHGLYVNGQAGASIETGVQLSWERISVCYNADCGILLTGSIYNGECGHAFIIENGKNNFRIQASGEPIGEMTFRQITSFAGGTKTGATGFDIAGVYIVSGGLIHIGMLTSTRSIGNCVVLAAGRYKIGSIWSETVGGTPNANHIIVQFGDGTTNPSAADIGFIVSSPGNAYPGRIVVLTQNTKRCNIENVLVDSTGLTQSLITFEANADANSIGKIFGSSAGGQVVNNGDGNVYQKFVNTTGSFTVQGLWFSEAIGIGKENFNNVENEYGHAFLKTGYANKSMNDSTVGGIGYMQTNANSSVPDGWKFNSFRIGSPTAEIGKIEVASSGTAINYATSSDYRLKENIVPMTGALEKLSMLKPVTYTWKRTGTQGQGFLAHELQEIFPDAVTGKKDETIVEKIYEKDSVDLTNKKLIEKEVTVPNYQGVDTSHLVATLVAAVQELKAEIELLKLKV